MISDELDAQPPNAAPSTTIPRIRILVVPGPTGIQPQPEVEGKGERKKGAPPRVAQVSSASPAGYDYRDVVPHFHEAHVDQGAQVIRVDRG